jgi:carboxypeptidase family protein
MPTARAALLAVTLLAVTLLAACGQRPTAPAGDEPPPDDTAAAHEQTVTHTPGTDQAPAMGSAVAGQVVDAAGRPVAGAMVQPRSLDQPAKPVPELAVVTDGQGNFVWTLPPGRYELAARHGGRTSPPVQVDVTADATVQATLVLG